MAVRGTPLAILAVLSGLLGSGCGGATLPPFSREAIWDVDTTRVPEGPESEAGLPAIPEPTGGQGVGETHGVPDDESPAESSKDGPGDEPGDATTPSGGYAVQVYAGRSMSEAETVDGRAHRVLGFPGRILEEGDSRKVQLGPFRTRVDAERARDRAREAGFGDAWITIWGAEDERR